MKKVFTSILVAASSIVIAQPVITSNPQSKGNCVDSCTYFRVAAVGIGLSYQWQLDAGSGFSNLTLPSATNDTLWVCDTGVVPEPSRSYRCIVKDVNGDSAVSNTAILTVDTCLPPVADFTYILNGTEICFTNNSLYASAVLWNFGDGNTSGSEDPCNDYGTAWIYDVTLYAFNDYGSDTITRTIDMVGVNELHNQFRMYPNPTESEFHLISDLRIDRISIFNLQGQQLMDTSVGSNKAVLDLGYFEPGLYTLVLVSGDNHLTYKIVRN